MKILYLLLLWLCIPQVKAQNIDINKKCCIQYINGNAVNLCDLTQRIFESHKLKNNDMIKHNVFYESFMDSLKSLKLVNKEVIKDTDFGFKDTTFQNLVESTAQYYQLAFWGSIIDIRTTSKNHCRYYKTEYIIVIDRMAGSFFDYNIGDTIFMQNTEGNMGGCMPGAYVDVSHYTPPQKGDSYFFTLYNSHYLYRSYESLLQNSKFKDPFCANIFFDYHDNYNNNEKWTNYEEEIIALFKAYYGE